MNIADITLYIAFIFVLIAAFIIGKDIFKK